MSLKWKLLSHVWLCADPMDCSLTGSEYLSGLPFPPPGDRPNPGVTAESVTAPALAGRFFTSSAIWEPMHQQICCLILVKHKKRYKIIFKNHQIYLWGLSDYPWTSWITKRFWMETFSSSDATPHFPKISRNSGNHLPYWATKTNPNTEYQHRAVLVWSLAGHHLLPCGMWEIS